MKNKALIAVALLLLLLTVVASGCGSPDGAGSGGNKKPEPIKLGEHTYLPEKIVRQSEQDSDSGKAYDVSVLIEGDKAPVILDGGISKSGVDLTLEAESGPITYHTVSFEVIKEEDRVDGYGAKATYSFNIPKDTEFPKKGTLIDGADSSKTAEVDLTVLPVEGE